MTFDLTTWAHFLGGTKVLDRRLTNVPTRPTPREIFLTKDKQLQVFFYTSNVSKYLQAKLVFDRAGLILQHFPEYD